MYISKSLPLLFIVLLLFFVNCKKQAAQCIEPDPSIDCTSGLKEIAPYPIGLATATFYLQEPAYDSILRQNFNSLTAEWQMKQNIIHIAEGSYNWQPMDDLVDYAQQNNIRIHGHALLWHGATPKWIEDYEGTSEEFEAIIKDYIQTVVGRYKGKITSWDVVNEAFKDNSGNLRATVFKKWMGDDYIARCFQYAREADPDVLLFYNDFNLPSSSSKCQAVLDMVEDFKARNIPIDGIGLQMHLQLQWPSDQQIQKTVEQIVETGLKIHFSELDVRLNDAGRLDSLTTEQAEKQAARYCQIARFHNQIPTEQQYGISIWGLRDSDSWIPQFFGNEDWPLLFDQNLKTKPAYEAFQKGLCE